MDIISGSPTRTSPRPSTLLALDTSAVCRALSYAAVLTLNHPPPFGPFSSRVQTPLPSSMRCEPTSEKSSDRTDPHRRNVCQRRHGLPLTHLLFDFHFSSNRRVRRRESAEQQTTLSAPERITFFTATPRESSTNFTFTASYMPCRVTK